MSEEKPVEHHVPAPAVHEPSPIVPTPSPPPVRPVVSDAVRAEREAIVGYLESEAARYALQASKADSGDVVQSCRRMEKALKGYAAWVLGRGV